MLKNYFIALVLPILFFGSTVLAQEEAGFEDFIDTSLEDSVSTTSSTEDTFESYVEAEVDASSTDSSDGVSTVVSPVTTSSTETNIGGSIYVPYDGPVFTGPGLEGGVLLAESLLDENVSKERDIKALIIGWMNFLLSVTALLAVIALVWAGFLYVTAAGDDGRMESAKKIVIWVVVGLLLILGAYAIVNTVMQAVF